MSLVDLHNHILGRSNDSELQISDLVAQCRARGIDGACITDHDRWLSVDEAAELTTRYDFTFFNGIEAAVGTLGHFLCYGPLSVFDAEVRVADIVAALRGLMGTWTELKKEVVTRTEFADILKNSQLARLVSGHGSLIDLVSVIHGQGGAVVWAHPLSHTPLRRIYDAFFHERPDASAEDFVTELEGRHADVFQVLQAVDALEGMNGCEPERGMVNRQVMEIARVMGKPVTGGSDAHSVRAVGACATRFADDVCSAGDLVQALRAGKCRAVALPSKSSGCR